MRRAIALAPLALVALGCGGDEAETVTVGSTEAAEPLSKAEYIAQSDQLCQQGKDEGNPLVEQAQQEINRGDYQAGAESLSKAIENTRPVYEQLAALPAPAGDETAIGELNDLRDQALALLERLEDAVRDEDDSRITSLVEEIQSLDARGDGLSIGYGFKVCGQEN